MKTKKTIKIMAMMTALCLAFSQSLPKGYASSASDAVTQVTQEAQQPAVSSESTSIVQKAAETITKAVAPTTDFLSNSSALIKATTAETATKTLEQKALSDGSVQNGTALTLEKQPSEQEISAIVDNVLSQMVDAGLEKDLSQALTYISSGDYTGLADFQKENPKILDKLSDSLQKISAAFPENNICINYVDRWSEEVNRVRENRPGLQQGVEGPGSPVEAVVKLYKPIAKRISEVTKSFEEASRISKDSEVKGPSSGNLLKNFSGKAKEFILNSVNRAHANLANGMLSDPLEPAAFAAETAAAQTSSTAFDQTAIREKTLAELYVKSKKYQVVDSVYIGKDFLYAQKMLHPPASLHPYLKWLLYIRNLTPRMVENYLATREAVGVLYEQAKAGQGNIRYKGKVYGIFLPFAETAAGNYELVKPVSPE